MRILHSGILLFTVSFIAACEAPPVAQSPAAPRTQDSPVATATGSLSDMELCQQDPDTAGHDGSASVEACTRLIDAGDRTPQQLAKLYNDRGVGFSEMRAYDKALRDYFTATNLDSNYALPWRNISDMHADRSDWQKSLVAAERFIELKPDSVSGYNRRARALRKLEKFGAALEDLELARALSPSNDWVQREIGWVYYDQQKYQLALTQFRESLKLDADDPENNYSIAYVMIDLERGAEALREINRAIDAAANNADLSRYLNLRGYIRFLEDTAEFDLAKAIADFERAIELDPNDHYPVFHLARAHALAGRGKPAIDFFRKGMRIRADLEKAATVVKAMLAKGLKSEANSAAALINRAADDQRSVRS